MIRIINNAEDIMDDLEKNRPYDKEYAQTNGGRKVYFAFHRATQKLINYIKTNKIIIILP